MLDPHSRRAASRSELPSIPLFVDVCLRVAVDSAELLARAIGDLQFLRSAQPGDRLLDTANQFVNFATWVCKLRCLFT